MESELKYTAFENHKILCRGNLNHVILKVKKRIDKGSNASLIIFSDNTGKSMDFNFHGSEEDVLKRLEVFHKASETTESHGPGRPKLGVVSREVSLLPRHWEWLATQPGGASATLRKLVEEAKKKNASAHETKMIQERTYKFMSVMAGDLKGYEEALRALYRKDKKMFLSCIEEWPTDIREHSLELADSIF
jgi:hypothetical protein